MKIDTHQHFWKFSPADFPWIGGDMPILKKDCLPADSQLDRQAADVDGVIAVQARTLPQETDFLLELASANAAVLGVVGWVDLGGPDLAAALEKWAEHPAMCGVRHILQDEADLGSWLADQRHVAGLRAVQRAGLVYDVLVYDYQLPMVAKFCAQHDAHWLVLDHLGKPCIRDWSSNPEVPARWMACIRNLATLPHVMCKLSGLVTETDWRRSGGLTPEDIKAMWSCFDFALEAFGPGRLMFGSDWPVCQLAAPYEAVHGLVHKWAKTRLTVAEQDAFWSSNAIRCYGLRLNEYRN